MIMTKGCLHGYGSLIRTIFTRRASSVQTHALLLSIRTLCRSFSPIGSIGNWKDRYAKMAAEEAGLSLSAQAHQRASVEHFAVRFECHTVLKGPLVKQRGIVRKVQQRSSNFLNFWHTVVHQVEASFFVGRFGIVRVLQPPDKSIAQLKLHLSHIQNVSAVRPSCAGKGQNAL